MTHYELNLRDYLRIIRKRKFVVIASFLMFGIAAYIYSKSEIPVYQATSSVKVEERKTVAGLLTEWIVYNPADVMETQTKMIKGYPVLKRAALELKLITDKDSDLIVSGVVSQLQGQVETEREGNTNIVKINVTTENPKEAMNVANAVAFAAVEYNLSEKNKQARTARQFIAEQLSNVENKLHEAEEKIKSYGKDPNETDLGQGEQQRRIADLELQLNALMQKYTEKHPKIAQLKEQISELENQLGKISGYDIDYARAKREVEVNRKLYDMLREKLEEVKITEAEKVSDVSIVDPALLPDSPTNSRSPLNVLLGGFLGIVVGLILSFIVETLDTSIGTIEDVENVIKLPVLGVLPSMSYEEERKGRSFFDKIMQKIFPKRLNEEERNKIALFTHYQPTSPITESFRNLKMNIKFSSNRKVILVTSAGAQEGKTTLVSNLGIVCAQDGLKTLLISADLRRPSLGNGFGIATKPGLTDAIIGTVTIDAALRNISDVMMGKMSIDEVLKHPGLGYLNIIPAGNLPLNPTEILGSKELSTILNDLRDRFDVIIFDAPPILPVADAGILATKVDGVILCYETGKTSRQALLRTKTQLEAVQANIFGIVLNHTKPDSEIADMYPYYYKYKYYAKSEKINKSKENKASE